MDESLDPVALLALNFYHELAKYAYAELELLPWAVFLRCLVWQTLGVAGPRLNTTSSETKKAKIKDGLIMGDRASPQGSELVARCIPMIT